MNDEREILVGFLNIVASPHPTGVYLEALQRVANQPVNIRGRDWAIITKPKASPDEDGIHEGTISVWTDVDGSEPSIDKSTFQQRDVEAELRRVFAERGFNNRGFSYILDEISHKVVVELRTETGKTISIKQVSRIFEMLLNSLNRDGQIFEVTVVPDGDAIEQVLGIDRLDKVHIILKRPNPGDHDGGDADDVLRELFEQNMRQAEYTFVRQPGTDGIHLSPQNEKRAEVAAENGYVQSAGMSDGGEREKRSTKEYPKIVPLTIAGGAIAITVLRAAAKRLRAR